MTLITLKSMIQWLLVLAQSCAMSTSFSSRTFPLVPEVSLNPPAVPLSRTLAATDLLSVLDTSYTDQVTLTWKSEMFQNQALFEHWRGTTSGKFHTWPCVTRHRKSTRVLKILCTITFVLYTQDVCGTSMNFVFRLGSCLQDISFYVGKYS